MADRLRRYPSVRYPPGLLSPRSFPWPSYTPCLFEAYYNNEKRGRNIQLDKTKQTSSPYVRGSHTHTHLQTNRTKPKPKELVQAQYSYEPNYNRPNQQMCKKVQGSSTGKTHNTATGREGHRRGLLGEMFLSRPPEKTGSMRN